MEVEEAMTTCYSSKRQHIDTQQRVFSHSRYELNSTNLHTLHSTNAAAFNVSIHTLTKCIVYLKHHINLRTKPVVLLFQNLHHVSVVVVYQ